MIPLLLSDPSDADILKFISGNDHLIFEMFKWLDNLTPYILSETINNYSQGKDRKSNGLRLATKPRAKLIESIARGLNLVKQKIPQLRLKETIKYVISFFFSAIKRSSTKTLFLQRNWRFEILVKRA